MAPQTWRAGRGIRLDFPGDQPIYTPGKTSRFLGCWSREPDSRVQTPEANGSARTAVSGPA